MFLALVFLVYFELFPAVLNLALVNCISAISLNTIKCKNLTRITFKSCIWDGLTLGGGKDRRLNGWNLLCSKGAGGPGGQKAKDTYCTLASTTADRKLSYTNKSQRASR